MRTSRRRVSQASRVRDRALGYDITMNHDQTPVLDAIQQFHDDGLYSFALPGHRLGRGIDDRTAQVLSRSTFAADVITAKSAVPEAEALYADAVGAKQAVFTTCGSSISIHTAVLTASGPGHKILVDRNVHKSVAASLILAGVEPVWLPPAWDHDRELAHPATADSVARALDDHPDVDSVLIITPTEYGTGADVGRTAALCHDRGIPLVVDEAWGGHFGFHPDPPTAAVQAGADLSVQSLHKADGGLCQASMILLGGDLIDPVDLRLRLDLITTTSPSALMYGSIDGWRRHLALNGKELIDGALHRASGLRDRLGKVRGLTVIDESIHDTAGVAEWDPLKLCVDVSALGLTGWQAMEWLQSEQRIVAQLGNARWVICSLTYADDDDAVEQLGAAFENLAAAPPPPDRPAPSIPPLEELNLEQVMSPHEAFFATTEQVSDPVGRIAAEMISPYPPGVPAILPGERFTEAVVTYLRSGNAAGMTLPDASDPTLKTLRVVRD
jgi:arginine decarboxylase